MPHRRGFIRKLESCSIPTYEVELPLTIPQSFQETVDNYELAREAIRPLEEKWADFLQDSERQEEEE